MPRILFCTFLTILIFTTSIHAKNNDPVVKVTKPASYTVKQALLFPFNIPAYVIRGITWPIGAGIEYAEQKHAIEKIINLLSNKERTFWVYPVIEGGAGSGFGGGLAMKHTDLFHHGYEAYASYKIHMSLDQHVETYIGKTNAFHLFDRPLSYKLKVNWKRILDEDYFGIGHDSKRSNQAEFKYTNIETEAQLSYEFIDDFHFKIFTAIDVNYTGHTDEKGNPSIEDAFPASQIGGFGKWLNYFVGGAEFNHDTRDTPSFTESGGIQKISLARYECLNHDDFNFIEYTADVKQYFRLFKPQRVLVLHAGWVAQQETQNSKIPFYKLATLDNGSPLRGFDGGRYRDRNSIIMNIEYRFPIWRYVISSIFFDTGQVFRVPSDFSFDNFTYSTGGALYLKAFDFLVFSFTAGYGGEGINIIFGMSKPL